MGRGLEKAVETMVVMVEDERWERSKVEEVEDEAILVARPEDILEMVFGRNG